MYDDEESDEQRSNNQNEMPQPRKQQGKKMDQIRLKEMYKTGFKLLKQSIRNNGLSPCVVFNLRHCMIPIKD